MHNVIDELYQGDEHFRDAISTVDNKGKRLWVYPRKPKGRLHNARIWVTVVLLTLFFSGPFIHINGHPLLLFNIVERKFILFGIVVWPQDFFLIALLGVSFFVLIILFTVVFGRFWCGWACPQTVFMEMVFRKIEYWIDGDFGKKKKLDQMPWNAEKIRKRLLKHTIFVAISLLISHTVLAYMISWEGTREMILSGPSANIGAFSGLMAFTAIFYWIFAYFREQACTVVCPYGRLQGALLDKESIVVAYDWKRGEPRNRIKKVQEAEQNAGDCIDCKLCVQVCPTGIDIRNGTQLECVNCTACIDACDDVMEKVERPKGLIRFSSYNAIKEGRSKLLTPRAAAYTIILMALISGSSYYVISRPPIEATIVKAQGLLYQNQGDSIITNVYNYQLANKTFEDQQVYFKIENKASGTISIAGNLTRIDVPSAELAKGIMIIGLKPDELESNKNKLRLGIYDQNKKLDEVKITFLGPLKIN